MSGRVLAPLQGIDYSFVERGLRRIQKHVDYYLLAYESGNEADFDPEEVVAARWFPWTEALAKLSHANERRVAEQAWTLVQAGASAADLASEGGRP